MKKRREEVQVNSRWVAGKGFAAGRAFGGEKTEVGVFLGGAKEERDHRKKEQAQVSTTRRRMTDN